MTAPLPQDRSSAPAGTLELQPRPRPAVAAPRGGRPDAAWARSAADWELLRPRALYPACLRGPFLWTVSCLLAPAALALALPIALVNACVQRGLRRAFFTQERVGLRGRVFLLVKFRTMHETGSGPRAGRFGRFLRNTHLDELPQFWNVLRGEMSLIGPRPEMVATERWAAARITGFSERLVLRPGLTGLAQITQGYARDGDERAYERKLELNRRYLATVSFGLDCSILVRTALWMLRGRGWRGESRAQRGRPSARS